MKPTATQIGLLQHSLGINQDRRTPYRNHFVAGDGHHDMENLRQLESMGLMTSRDNGPQWGGLCFYVTEPGKAIAIDNLPPELKRKRTQYEEYLDSECCDRFGEWLCGRRLPRYESEYRYAGNVRQEQWRSG